MHTLGGQRVGVGWKAPGDTVNEFMRPATADTTVWVSKCLFEIQDDASSLATVTDTTTTTVYEVAWCFMPVNAGRIPAVDGNGQRVWLAVGDVNSGYWLTFGGKKFMVASRASLEYDDDGREDHVFCIGKRRRGGPDG